MRHLPASRGTLSISASRRYCGSGKELTMLNRCLLILVLALAVSGAQAAEQTSPARAVFAASCLQLAMAMSLQGDMQKRFVDECIRSKETVNNKGAPTGPFEAHPAC